MTVTNKSDILEVTEFIEIQIRGNIEIEVKSTEAALHFEAIIHNL